MSKLDELRQRSGEINDRCQQIMQDADGENRELTAEERTEFRNLKDEFVSVREEIDFRDALDKQGQELTKPAYERPSPNGPPIKEVLNQEPGDPKKKQLHPEYAQPKDGKWGYQTLGHFAQAVRLAATPGAVTMDSRLARQLAQPSTYGSEGVGADGGFAVPPDFRAEIQEKVMGNDSLLGLTDNLITSSNSITIPVDETTPWQTSGGVLTYWVGENTQITESKPALQQVTVQLHKLAALVPVTEELNEDAPALDRYLRRKAPEKINFAIDKAIISGNGVGKPLGILNSGSLVEAGSRTGTELDLADASRLYMGVHAAYRNRPSTVWICNPDLQQDIFQINSGTNNNVFFGIPTDGIQPPPGTTLLGHRIIYSHACESRGTKGDIYFAAMGEYMTATKSGGVRVETSIHLYFDYDATAYRFIIRVAGQPWLSTTISALNGSETYSAFVTLPDT